MSIDPSQGLDNALNEATNDINNINQQYTNLRLSVALMMDMIRKAGHDPMAAFEAMQMAQNVVMPEMMQVQGTKVVGVSDGLNIASALRAFNTYLQQFFNKGGSITPKQAQEFANGLNELHSFLYLADIKNSLPKFLDKGSYDSLCSALQSIYGAFSNTNDPNPAGHISGSEVFTAMKAWFANTPALPLPQGLYPSMKQEWINSGGTGAVPEWFEREYLQDHPSISNPSNSPNSAPPPQISVIQGAFQQMSTTVSSVSQTQQTLIQYDSNLYNQLVGIQQKVLDSSKTLGMAMVQNQKAS